MKQIARISAVLLAVLVLLASCGGAAIYKAGTYEGEGQGHNGTIKIALTVDSEKITKIEVLENPESEFSIGPINTLIESAIESNSGDIDAVSGASDTSNGLIEAINDALSAAYLEGAGSAEAGDQAKKEAVKDDSCDIVIVGAGGAGLSAAISAGNSGADVIVLEKMAIVGGNTNYATGGLNAAETSSQEALDIEDSAELFFEDTMKGGKNVNNPALVKVLTENSAKTVEWLKGLGADLSDVGRLGGASANRAHRPTGGKAVGAHLASVLYEAAKPVADIRTENTVTAISGDENGVTGVEVSTPNGDYHISAKAVIVASGGFGASQEKVVAFDPSLKGFGTTNHPGATGDAIDFVSGLSAAFVDMEQIQTHPTVVPVKNKMITEAVRGNGAILVNRQAERFISELETRDVVSEAELQQEGKTSFLVFDQGVRDSLAAIEKYAKAGLLTEADSLEALADAIEIDGSVLADTVARYNGFVDAGEDADFQRVDMPRKLETAPYYAVEVGPAVHHTMGGLKIDDTARVMNESGSWISGLYAAGEVSGGVHGANRLGGNALSDITTFGRLAGSEAAAFVEK